MVTSRGNPVPHMKFGCLFLHQAILVGRHVHVPWKHVLLPPPVNLYSYDHWEVGCWVLGKYRTRNAIRDENYYEYVHQRRATFSRRLCDRTSTGSHINWMDIYVITHWSRDKTAAISQTTFSNAFSWIRVIEFRLKCHWGLFQRVQPTIFQHWFW